VTIERLKIIQDRRDVPPVRQCTICSFELEHMALLPRSLNFPMQRVYRCVECKTVVNVTEE
jgi:DNA-directed RNA polymerase subunit RPC12/RpoP